MKPGNLFGELQLIGLNVDKNDQAIAVLDSLVCFMKTETIKRIMLKNSDFCFTIHKLLGARVLKIERKLELMILKNFLTNNDIAKLTGTTKETVYNTINDLQFHNMIKYNKRQLEIYPSCYIN